MAGRLDGKVALISGAARGMGETEARLFAREGARVVLGDVLEEQGQQGAREIAQQGGAATFVHLDVTIEGDWQRAVETAEQTYGKLNVLVNRDHWLAEYPCLSGKQGRSAAVDETCNDSIRADKIRVNSVHPGRIETPMTANITPERREMVLRR